MRLASFERKGRPGFGIVVGDGVVDLAARFAGNANSLREVLASVGSSDLERLAGSARDFGIDELAFAPVIPDAAAELLCVGINYMPHIKEMGRERPERPVRFVRFGDSVVGHGRPLLAPRGADQFGLEGELAVVIGK